MNPNTDDSLEKFKRVSRVLERNATRALRQMGLTYSQYRTLLIAERLGGSIPLGVVADEMDCSRGNLTGVMDRLERDGWITRDRSTDDRRVVNVQFVDSDAVRKRWAQAKALVAGTAPTLPANVDKYLVGMMGSDTAVAG